MGKEEKKQRVNTVITSLGLDKCRNTIIGACLLEPWIKIPCQKRYTVPGTELFAVMGGVGQRIHAPKVRALVYCRRVLFPPRRQRRRTQASVRGA